jgi:hypothetical protein
MPHKRLLLLYLPPVCGAAPGSPPTRPAPPLLPISCVCPSDYPFCAGDKWCYVSSSSWSYSATCGGSCAAHYSAPPPSVPPALPPMSPPMSPLPRCHDDPNYWDVWDCSQWAGYACASGYDPVTTPERIALLMHSCPQSCTDSTPLCPPPPPSSPAFPQQPPPPPPAPPSPPRPPLHPRERLILPGSTLQSEVDAAPAGSVLVLAEVSSTDSRSILPCTIALPTHGSCSARAIGQLRVGA